MGYRKEEKGIRQAEIKLKEGETPEKALGRQGLLSEIVGGFPVS